ncbi:hypothetical protein BTJ40_14460 [Microbulbifer sp. A4B17]|uniref:RHS repeat domain-containing protein n=1 Tax=Microbulbifer sp. A4B17 TaxID=359370 RepID=UPI000D52D9D2|nr:RHS repeat protein [Microbulbifer sp. A4B17]AWF81931.1 hypothetical protein BTJ40_14460 [Microbulbifer sp. A4B17]
MLLKHRAILISLIALLGNSSSSYSGEPEAGTIDSNKKSIKEQLPGEFFDNKKGEVFWDINLLNIPGPAGLDISISLSFDKFKKGRSSNDHYVAGNWQLELPRIRHSSWNGYDESYYKKGCEHPIGSEVMSMAPGPSTLSAPGVTWLSSEAEPRSFLHNKNWTYFETGQDAERFLPSNYDYVSLDNWVSYCDSNGLDFITKSPNGRTYTLDVLAWDYGDNWLHDYIYGWDDAEIIRYASRVEDIHGNWIDYEYEHFTTTTKDSFNKTIYGQQALIKKITASDGRVVTFDYTSGDRKKLKAINAYGRTWELSYKNEILDKIIYPDESFYEFEYEEFNSSLRITAVSTPTGAKLDYTYSSVEFLQSIWDSPIQGTDQGADYYNWPIISRKISGKDIDTLSITYSYSSPSESTSKTEIHYSTTLEKLFFHRGDNKQGFLSKHEIYEDGSLKRLFEYDWVKGEYYGHEPYGWSTKNFPFQTVVDRAWVKTLLSAVTVDSKYKTEYSNFDIYGNPRSVTHSGDGTKHISRTYYNNTSGNSWIIGLTEDETFTNGEKINRTYDSNGRLTYLDEFGLKKQFSYHSNGDLHKEIGFRDSTSRQIVTEHLDYNRGVPQKTLFTDGSFIERDVSSFGEVISERNQLGDVTNYQYDEMSRIKLIDRPSFSDIIITWPDPSLKVESRANSVTETIFDSLGRELLVKRYDKDNPSEAIYSGTKYDELGRVIFKSFESESSSNMKGVEYGYDALNRKTWVKKSDNSIDHYYYDEDWNTLSGNGYPHITNGYGLINSEGYFQTYDYKAYGDPDNRELYKIHEQIVKDGSSQTSKYVTTTMSYTDLGDIKSVTQSGLNRTFEYHSDRPKLLKKLTQPEIGDITFNYDYAGNMTARSIGGNTTNYVYNDLNQLISIDYPGATNDITYDYYASGDINWKANGASKLIHTYNKNRQLSSETLEVDGYSKTIRYGYNDLGDMSSVTYPSGSQLELNPDVFGRPRTLGKFSSYIDYHPNGIPETVKLANGITASFTLDNRHFIKSIDSTGPKGSPIRYHYTYDSLGNVDTIMDYKLASNDRSMSYDGLNRLVTAYSNYWEGINEYHYDDIGNITKKVTPSSSISFNYNNNNLLTSTSSGKSFSYDSYGNITSNGSFSFVYNHASRLTNAAGKIFTYDASGNRIKTNKGSETNYHFYNKAGQLMYEWDSTKSSDYIYLGTRLFAKEEYCSETDTDSDGIPDCVETSWGLDPNNNLDAVQDLDSDGASNLLEYQYSTSLILKDTDGDNIDDGYEIRFGLSPLDPTDADSDSDNDGLTNYQEYLLNTDPKNSDTDGDGIPDKLDDKPNFNLGAFIAIISTTLH